MDYPLISVIVPVYNVEKYLNKCVQSLLAQTYPNYEIILVDDGSPDHCPAMCDAYEEQYENITVFHKENGGQSDARNYGVKRARGEWVVFVDSDDYVAENYIACLFDLRKKFNADMAVVEITPVYDDNPPAPCAKEMKELLLTNEDALKRMCYANDFGVSPCAKLYPKYILEKNPYPAGVIFEDLATTYKILDECHSIAFGAQHIYFYRKRLNSTMHQQFTEKHLYIFTVTKELIRYMDQYHPSVACAGRSRCAFEFYQLIPNLFSGTQSDKIIFKRFQKELRPHYKIVMSDREAPFRLKVKSTAVMLGYWPTKLLWKAWLGLKGIPDVYDQNTE